MKKLFVLTLALFTVLTLGAFAQDQTAPSGKKSKKSTMAASDTATTKAKTAKLTGTIGQDGKSFTNDADQSSWTISNPDKVKGHEGHHVTVHAKTDDANKSIEVTSVAMVAAKKSTKSKM